jgi:hypothetical protein
MPLGLSFRTFPAGNYNGHFREVAPFFYSVHGLGGQVGFIMPGKGLYLLFQI